MTKKIELTPENRGVLLAQISALSAHLHDRDSFGVSLPGAGQERSNFATFHHHPPAHGFLEEFAATYWTEAVFGEDLPNERKKASGKRYYETVSEAVLEEINLGACPGLSASRRNYCADSGEEREAIRLHLAMPSLTEGRTKKIGAGAIALDYGEVVVRIYAPALELFREGRFDYPPLLVAATYRIREKILFVRSS